uniref:Kelch domain-containing protein 3 n=1 Tax=Triatoma infestans TaxID=30076 RepID=A0A023F194_TRIIF
MYWTTHLKTGPRRVNHAAAAVGETIYTFGGYCTEEILVYRVKEPIDVHVLNINCLEWHQLPRPKIDSQQYAVTPFQRYGHTAVAFGKNIFIWGGRNDESACNRLFCFDTETWLWSCPTTTGVLPCSRDGHSACIIGSSMYIFGGYEEEFERYSQEVYALDLLTMHWTYVVTQGSPPDYRDFHTGTTIGNRMYIFGGRSDFAGPHSSEADYYPNEIVYLDTSNMTWHKPETKGEFPIGRRSHSAFLYKNNLYIFGGFNGILNEHYNDMYSFCPLTNTWRPVTTLGLSPKKRRRQVCIVIHDKMYLFGGTSPNPICLAEEDTNNMAQEMLLMDHDDLHVLDLRPTLKTLCMLSVISYNQEIHKGSLPDDVMEDLEEMRRKSVACY